MTTRTYRLAAGVAVAVALAMTLAARSLRPTVHRSAPQAPAGLPRLVEVGADSCAPCKAMEGVLARLRRDYAGKLAVEHIDSWDRPEEARRLGVKTSPTILFYDAGGRELRRMEGYVPADRIVQVFRKLGVEL